MGSCANTPSSATEANKTNRGGTNGANGGGLIPGYGYNSDTLGGGGAAQTSYTCNGVGDPTITTTCMAQGGSGGAGGAGGTVYYISGFAGTVKDGGNAGTSWTGSQIIKGRSTNGYGSGAGYHNSGTSSLANGASNGSRTAFSIPGTISGTSAATTTTLGQLAIKWTTPTTQSVAPITQIQITDNAGKVWATYSGSSLTSDMKTAGKVNTVNINGFTQGQTYTLYVKATNIAGTRSSSAFTGTPFTTPATPTGVTAAPNGANGQLAVGWTTAANNGAAITKVEIINTRASNKVLACTDTVTGAQKLTLSTAMTTAGQKPSVTLTGLTGGTTYGIAIRVTNAAGSTTSSSVNAVPNGPPMAPTNVTAAGTGVSGQIRINWTTAFRTGNAAITGFRILDNNNLSLIHI